MIVGVPKEVKEDEYSAGHTVYVEKTAGVGSSIPDEEFAVTGATMVADPDDIWADSDMILGVKEPIPVEYPRLGLRSGQVLFTYLHLAASLRCTEALMAAGNTAIAYETVRLADPPCRSSHP
jgi:alanine dehydrogenase